ncbi:LysM domain-containing protein [uncultured Aeromicrobium sp.]|uniref:LysM peptidoglycan-binding domain-containing protein n=1 Tax=uncultured Aeromicrobium sp. TaxID=337820 RepID=UPI0025E2359B|nr:LysM domain-containing protein [uncultured Aeromicrobium sp.]
MSTIVCHDFAGRPAPQPARRLHSVPLAPPTQSAAAPLRLTRRGRIVVFGAVALLLAVLSILLGASVAATDDAPTLPTTTVQVQPGQTLWQIAADANPRGDIRNTIDDIVRLNALPNASGLKMGTTLAVPVYED